MEFSLSGIGHFIDSMVLLIFYFRLRKNSTIDNRFFRYFEGFAISMSTFLMFMALPNFFFQKNSFILGLGYIIGHMFMYIALAYIVRVWLLVSKPSFDSSIVFKIYLVLGLAATVLNVYLFNFPTVNESGITLWNAQQPVAMAIIFFAALSFLPAIAVFIVQAIKQPKVRTKYIIISISFLLMVMSGPVHDIATTTGLYMFADIVTTLAFIFMFFGVVMSNKSKKIIKE